MELRNPAQYRLEELRAFAIRAFAGRPVRIVADFDAYTDADDEQEDEEDDEDEDGDDEEGEESPSRCLRALSTK